LPLPGYESFEKAKLNKVQEILQTTDTLEQADTTLMQDLTLHQEKYIDFLDIMSQST
jgi:hypothetical protein